jgi:hypothetical protein
MTNERHTRREFLGIAGAGLAGVATGASFDHKRSEKPSHFWLHNCCRTGVVCTEVGRPIGTFIDSEQRVESDC